MKQQNSYALGLFAPTTKLLVMMPLLLGIFVAGCSTTDNVGQSNSHAPDASIIPRNIDQALREKQKVLTENKSQQDIALYDIGVLSAHSENPKKDYFKALNSFKTLIKDYPASPRAEPAKIWIQAIELNFKNLEEAQKLAEEKRAVVRERDALARERDQLTQERNKLNYAIEKSRQLDADIEKRRKQLLKR